MSDYHCNLCRAPAGFMVQGGGCIIRCSQCDAPGAAAVLSFIADGLQSRYSAVLLSKASEELSVVAEGIGREITSTVLAASMGGKFVWMKPICA